MRVGTYTGWSARAGLLLLLVFANSGCGSAPAGSVVNGTVTYKGEPVPAGKVSFYGPNDQFASVLINEDGSYEAENVPLGAVKVAVSTPLPPPPEIEKAAREGKRRFGKGNVIQTPQRVVSIPSKYSDPGKSGLSLTVTANAQVFNIELK
jgi:hypothetical protein